MSTVDPTLASKLRNLRDCLTENLIERDVAIRLALIASLAGEHLLLLGPPGTAKSLVARRLHLAFTESSYFERLLTRFTVPEELFGPLSIKGLEEDRYERLIAAYLPTASIAFLDEIFKANSAILNALLTLLNEREFDNGSQRIKVPLVAVIGASNELPEGDELGALFDRFLLRLHVGPVTKEAFANLLSLRGQATPVVPEALRLTETDLRAVQTAAESVEVPADVAAMLCDLRDWCTAEEIAVSDRRWRKIVKLLQVAALTNNRNRVSIWDCWLLQHCLWDTPEGREKIHDWYSARVGASAAMTPSILTRVVVSWEAKLKADQESRSQMRNKKGQPLFKEVDGKPTTNTQGQVQKTRDGEPLFLAPANSSNQRGEKVADRANGGKGFTLKGLDSLYVDNNYVFRNWARRDSYIANANNWLVEDDLPPYMEPTRHKRAYIEASLNELGALRADVGDYQKQLAEHRHTLEQDIRSHLWVTPDFVEPAAETLKQTAQTVETLLTRVNTLRAGFELLPREQDEGEIHPIPSSKV